MVSIRDRRIHVGHYPLGFRAGGIQAGLRITPGLDLALIVNDGPADVVAGVFTTNRVCAAPVQWSRHVTADHKARAVIANAAVANACTGIDASPTVSARLSMLRPFSSASRTRSLSPHLESSESGRYAVHSGGSEHCPPRPRQGRQC
ncbi:glutamate N-acetyltransferase [Cutibacterium acnes JCM 18909]|nr:glutamate N-acetyltransferase [Cutibacterium acnes JCM 18909]